MHWDVAKAVEEGIRAVKGGALPLTLSASAVTRLRSEYTKSFQAMHDDGRSWPKEKPLILVLARLLGHIAVVEETRRALQAGKLPVSVSEQSAMFAAEVVAMSRWCLSPQDGPGKKTLGGWCPSSYKRTLRKDAMVEAIGPLFRGPQRPAKKKSAAKKKPRRSKTSKTAPRSKSRARTR